jgi:carbonic anhydrase/acetyltransferase-like protein (isoleucine patch superfamily)
VIRGDVNKIRIGNNVNIQDGSVIHATYKKSSTSVGNYVSVGHNAIIHGCTIDDFVLIGMGSIVMDNAKISSNTIIAAGSVILENTVVESNSVYGGIPAKKIKDINQSKSKNEIERIAKNYLIYSSWYK